MSDMITAIDVCCGAGGWACAARGLPIRIVGAFDVHEPCLRTYALNHPATAVRKLDCRELDHYRPTFTPDLILGGIPCQWLSVRRQAPVPDAERQRQRDLLDAVQSWIKYVGPRWWCLENVSGMAGELEILTPHIVLDAAGYSAQRRKRMYAGVFPNPSQGHSPSSLRSCVRPGPYRLGRRLDGRELKRNRTFAPRSAYAADLDRKGPTVCAWSSNHDGDIGIVDDSIPSGRRQIEWQEAATLQGFPDDYVFWGSPTDVWQMIGDAIQIDTARAILEAIVREWRSTNAREPRQMVAVD